MELTSGSMLKNRYLIKEQLGKGGMGAVFMAEDTALDQLVAVKSNAISSDQGIRQFETEARLLAKLRHPNLPLVFDHFIIDNIQYLVMDYIPGDDLNSRLKEEGPQSVQDVLSWAEQIASALSYLHSQDPPVIHRDIKPANLKLTPSGQIVLVDFGIAKATAGETTIGARGYSPGYAPPEQYSNASTGPYSDQYSLAATTYALLTGGPPPESVDMMLGQETLASTRLYSKEIPIHVDQAIQKAMSIEPDNRFSGTAEFMRALKNPAAMAEATIPLGAEAQVDQPTLIHSKKRSPWLWIGGVAAIVLIAVVGYAAFSILGGGSEDTMADLADLSPTAPVAVAAEATDSPAPLPTETATPEPVILPTDTLEPTITPTASPEPTPLGMGGKIAFISRRDGSLYDQIYVMDSDGSNVTQLTFDETHKSWPMWSPDGTQILYVGDGGRGLYNNSLGLDIWVMGADGSDQTNLTQFPSGDEDPTWSPDGSKIVWISRRFGGTRQLMIMNADGSEPVRLSGEWEEYNPTFSPDGDTLL
ncbi:MAG TPA: protein kinase, partial [Anaerolineales bacterium]|nr:protein kinase [Anaerolineales bacterium]